MSYTLKSGFDLLKFLQIILQKAHYLVLNNSWSLFGIYNLAAGGSGDYKSACLI